MSATPADSGDPAGGRGSTWGAAPVNPLRGQVLVTLLVSLGVALLLRYFVVEPPEIGHACDVARWQGGCALRSALLLTFAQQQLGWISLIGGGLGLLLRSRWLARIGLIFGCLGLVLYSYDTSAAGLLLALLVFCRGSSKPTP